MDEAQKIYYVYSALDERSRKKYIRRLSDEEVKMLRDEIEDRLAKARHKQEQIYERLPEWLKPAADAFRGLR